MIHWPGLELLPFHRADVIRQDPMPALAVGDRLPHVRYTPDAGVGERSKASSGGFCARTGHLLAGCKSRPDTDIAAKRNREVIFHGGIAGALAASLRLPCRHRSCCMFSVVAVNSRRLQWHGTVTYLPWRLSMPPPPRRWSPASHSSFYNRQVATADVV